MADKSQQDPSQKLDVPSESSRSIRKELLVEKLLQPKNDRIQTTAERSTILDQVKAFMPKLKTANEDLDTVDTSVIQVDAPREGEPYVEMNLQLYAENSGTSDSDSDSTNSTVSSDSSSDSGDEAIPTKQRKLISEVNSEGDAS